MLAIFLFILELPTFRDRDLFFCQSIQLVYQPVDLTVRCQNLALNLPVRNSQRGNFTESEDGALRESTHPTRLAHDKGSGENIKKRPDLLIYYNNDMLKMN